MQEPEQRAGINFRRGDVTLTHQPLMCHDNRQQLFPSTETTDIEKKKKIYDAESPTLNSTENIRGRIC